MKQVFKLALLSAIAFVGKAVNPLYDGCKGIPTEAPLIKQTPKLLTTTQNGEKYEIKHLDNIVTICNVTGTSYEMGYAQGVLLKEEIIENFDGLIDFAKAELSNILTEKQIPKFLIKGLTQKAEDVVQYLLDQNWIIAKPYTPQRFIDEMQGIADGTGTSFDFIMEMNMIPELVKAACSIVGAWDQATKDNKLLTLRALDWSASAPINRHPSITVYHSSEEGSHPFANIGYAGLIGALTAVGSQGVSIQEKIWIPTKENDANIPTTYQGKPWAFVLRDLAEFGTTLESMAQQLEQTDRTCRIHIGMSSAQDHAFEGVNYSWKVLDFFTDKNYTDYEPFHPQFDGIMYFDKHADGAQDYCVGQCIEDFYGEITWETLYRQIGGNHRTGDSQICVTDVYNNEIYLSYSAYETNVPAYLRSPIYIDLKPFFGLPQGYSLQ